MTNLFNLGQLSNLLNRVAGIWNLANDVLQRLVPLAMGLWGLATTWAFYERYRRGFEDAEEIAYQGVRSGVAAIIILSWSELFNEARLMLQGFADEIATPQIIYNELMAGIKRGLLSLNFSVFTIFSGPGAFIMLGIVLASLFFLFAVVYLLVYQAVALTVAYVFGPIAFALYPSQDAGKITLGYIRSTIKLMLLPMAFSILLLAFARIGADVFSSRSFGLLQMIVMFILGFLTLRLPGILNQLDTAIDTAGRFAGGLLVSTAGAVAGAATYLGMGAARSAIGVAVKRRMGATAHSAAAPATITSPRVGNPFRVP